MRFHTPQPLTGRPSVTVVIPCYNYGHFLPDAVACALDQQGVDVDVIVVDDASPDGSAQVARQLAAEHPQVEAILHQTNQGHIRTYNEGLSRARGDYVALVSADDLLPRDALTRAAALMETHPSVGFVYGFARSFSDVPPPTSARTRSWTVWAGEAWLRNAVRQGRCVISSPEVVMRREALARTELYDPRLPHSGDFDMWLQTAARWDVGRVNGPEQALYRVHPHNMHLTTYSGWLTDLQERRTTFDILFSERARDLPEITRLRPRASRALAREAVRRALEADRRRSGRSEVDALLQFATETWPGVRRSLRFRCATIGLGSGRQLPARRVRASLDRVRHHLLWRRERRFGV